MSTSFQLKRSNTPDKRPDPALLLTGELALNYDAETGGVYYTDDAGDIIKVGPAQVSATAPNSTPAGEAGNSLGEFWLDISGTPTLKIWNGAAWVISTSDTSVSTLPLRTSATVSISQYDPGTPTELFFNFDQTSIISVGNYINFTTIPGAENELYLVTFVEYSGLPAIETRVIISTPFAGTLEEGPNYVIKVYTSPVSLNNLVPGENITFEYSVDNEFVTISSNSTGGGTVTSVATGTGLTGGPITSTGTIDLADTTVTPGTYDFASITVDQQGRISAASTGIPAIGLAGLVYEGRQVNVVGPTNTFTMQGNNLAYMAVGTEFEFEGYTDTFTVTDVSFAGITTTVTVTPDWTTAGYTPFTSNRILKAPLTNPSVQQISGGNGVIINYGETTDEASLEISSYAQPQELLFLDDNGSFFGVSGVTTDGTSISTGTSGIHITGGLDGQFLQTDGDGNLRFSGISINASGSDTQVQFNDNGAFGASPNFTFDNSALSISQAGDVGTANFTLAAVGSFGSDPNTVNFFWGDGSTPCDLVFQSRGSNTLEGGNIRIFGGIAGNGGRGGEIYIASGTNLGSPNGSGDIQIRTPSGGSGSATVGSITILTGNGSPGDTIGDINLIAGKIAGVVPTGQINLDGIVNLGSIDTLHITGGSSDQYLQTDGAGNLSFAGVSINAAGSNTQVQFNDNGAFGANVNFSFDSLESTLSVPQIISNNVTSSGANLILEGGDQLDNNTAGFDVTITAGDGNGAADGGDIVITGGVSRGLGSAGGNVVISGGNGDGEFPVDGGDVIIEGGIATVSGTNGTVSINDITFARAITSYVPANDADLTTKSYVDGLVAAPGTVTGAVNISNATASSSKTTGALIVAGGVGVSGDVYANAVHTDSLYAIGTNITAYSDIVPNTGSSRSLGSEALPWQEVYIQAGSLHLAASNPSVNPVSVSNAANYFQLSGGGFKIMDAGGITTLYQVDPITALVTSDAQTQITNANNTTGLGTGSFQTAGGAYVAKDLIVTGSITANNLIVNTPNYATIISTATQLNTTVNTAHAVTYSSVEFGTGITIANNSRVTVSRAGVYNFIISVQVEKSNSGSDNFDLWFGKNGTYIPNSTSHYTLVSTTDNELIAVVNLVLPLVANDYIQYFWSSADANIFLLAQTGLTNPVRPDVPSVILTVTEVK